MTLTVKTSANSYSFDGPYTSAQSLEAQSGVYVITTRTPEGTHQVIDAGESGNVHNRVTNHDRSRDWERYKQDGIYMSGYYCDEPTRMLVEKDVRSYFNPSCGDR